MRWCLERGSEPPSPKPPSSQEVHGDIDGAQNLYEQILSLPAPKGMGKVDAWAHVPTTALVNYASLLSRPETTAAEAAKAESLFSRAIERDPACAAGALSPDLPKHMLCLLQRRVPFSLIVAPPRSPHRHGCTLAL